MPTEPLAAEHQRLERQVAELQREHDQLEAQPYDRAKHVQHRARLRANIEELRAHARRLRGEIALH